MTNTISVSTLDDLRDFVQRTICDEKQLLFGAFEFSEKVLMRHGRPCSMHFFLCGPRAVQFSAIWDVSRRTLLFYDCDGQRFCVSQLNDSEGLKNELGRLAVMQEKLAA